MANLDNLLLDSAPEKPPCNSRDFLKFELLDLEENSEPLQMEDITGHGLALGDAELHQLNCSI